MTDLGAPGSRPAAPVIYMEPLAPVPAAGAPSPLRRPAGDAVTGRRVSAALVDIALLTGLLIAMSAAVGQFSVGGGDISFSITGAWALVYLASLFLYYFAFEAATGQTLGKRLFGLRVVRADGGRPSRGAIAGRTALRIVDWAPALYLVGFIAIIATGQRRQRLGDLAAGTVVVRA